MIISLTDIERDIERRGCWMPVTSQVELTPKGERRTWIAYIYNVRTQLAQARAGTPNEAKRAAYEALKKKEGR